MKTKTLSALVLYAVIIVTEVFASKPATAHPCPGDPNSQCRGPEVGPFQYIVSDGIGGSGSGRTQSEAVAAFRQQAFDAGFCTFDVTDQLPPRVPDPSIGHGQVGDYSAALYFAQGTFYAWQSMVNTEWYNTIIPLKVQGTRGWSCERQHGPTGAYVQRARSVQCPAGWAQDNNNGRCYRWKIARDPRKNFGGQCTIANPVNGATGNKFQQEIDYQAPSGPLAFIRYYNSLASSYGDTAAPSSLGSNWRSNYDSSVRFGASVTYPTAYAYRPDGRMFAFDLVNGAFQSDPDVHASLIALKNSAEEIIGWTFVNEDSGSIETYDQYGQMVGLANRSGVALTIVRDGKGRVSSVTDSFGRALHFSYDANSRVQSMTDPDGGIYQYGYDAYGNSTSVTFPVSSGSKTYVYNEQIHTGNRDFRQALTGIIDESSNRFATFQYNGNYRVSVSEHAGGADRHEFTYEGTLNPSTVWVADPLQQQRTYTFTNIQGVARGTGVSQPCSSGCSAAAATTYDASANVTSKTDFKGNKICFAYDTNRNLETVRVEGLAPGSVCPANLATYAPPSGTHERKIVTQWHPTYRLPTQVNEAGRRTNYTHDTNGNILNKTVADLTVTPNATRTWAYTYDAFGKVLTANGPRTDVNDTTTYTYYTCNTGYQCGQVHTITNALGHVTTYNSYNAHGQPLTFTDPNGVVTTLTYDLRQRLLTRTIGSEQTSFDYWPTGLLKKATLPDGSYLEYTYDAAHRLTDINDAEGNSIHYTLDAMGNRTNEEVLDSSQTLSRTRTQVFNTLNQLWKQIGAAGGASVTTEFTYDNNGNQTAVNAPLGRNTAQTYDELNRLKTVSDSESGLTTFGYNALDQLISVTDPKQLTTSYVYNGLGDLKQQISPDTGTTTNTYDSGGNLKTSTDARSLTTTYSYDALDRVMSAEFAAGGTTDQVISYSYDAGSYGKGRLTGASDADHSLAWTYDEQGRPLTSTQSIGGVSKTTGYTYTNGHRTTMTTPSGQLISYGYTNGQLSSISVNGNVVVSDVLYDPFGPVRQWTWGNGTFSNRTFDLDGKITQLDSAGLKTYSYDDAFRITGITDTSNSAFSWSYDYDDLDRLTSASNASTTLGYTYDANGNRLVQTGTSPSTFAVAANSNRLTSTSGVLSRSYNYDNAGNTTSYTGTTFTYNNRGRMKSSTRNETTTNYTHNALGQLIKKGSSSLFYYDDAGHIIGIYDGSGALSEEIVWLGDIPVATLRPKSGGGVDVFYIHTDHLNAPRVITQPSDDAVRWRWDSDPFGVGTPNENPSALGQFVFNLRFPGQMYVPETGLYYNYFRDYDPATGRYVQSDPIGLEGGVNTYGYGNQNPLRNIDPTGLVCTGVPDNPFRFKFAPCCREHDDCYGDCGDTRSECDEKFYECMLNQCRNEDGRLGRQSVCRNWARHYWMGVRLFGSFFFEGPQTPMPRPPYPDYQ